MFAIDEFELVHVPPLVVSLIVDGLPPVHNRKLPVMDIGCGFTVNTAVSPLKGADPQLERDA